MTSIGGIGGIGSAGLAAFKTGVVRGPGPNGDGPGGAGGGDGKGPDGLTDAERQKVKALQERDQEVRAHEAAHAQAGGPYTGAPSFSFEKGPDGRLYAVDGEVKIDTKPLADPVETIKKMETVISAALAPADPSSQDRKVASDAREEKAKAVAEARKQRLEGDEGGRSGQGGQAGQTSLAALTKAKEGGGAASPENQAAGDPATGDPAARAAAAVYETIANAAIAGASQIFSLVA